MIKELNKSYLNELVELNELSYMPALREPGHSTKGVREYFEYTFKEGKVFGYFIDNKLIGCVGIMISDKFGYGDVEHLLVNPKFQGRGIGKELMAFIDDYVMKKKKKLKELRLSVRVDNEKAQGLYEKVGFKKHAYTMRKKLVR